MICVKEWKKKNIAYLIFLIFMHICAVRSKLKFCPIIPIILIGNSLCSLEHDMLYIIEFVCVFLDNIS